MKIEGLKEMEDALVALGQKAGGRALRRALNHSTSPVKTAARRNVNSERVRRSIKSKVVLGKGATRSVASVLVGVLGRDAYIGNFIEKGTKPHDIPGIKKTLKGRKNSKKVGYGNKVYSRVHHPGTQAKPFMQSAWNNNYRKSLNKLSIRLRERIVIEALKESKR
ncbi:hypothetical protein [Shewanella surugensis]|uniref:HK97 gp10 family phage protein n=1 Tax=Shewanella surugensis TaxID=212020 RepID=A0ABT0LHW3_9GAMM|nr:hypothetical protein [Shewanella surugensis]MCL1126711.1 hypothetical protein [Shewanella surugensis]